jgi:hypothetical protein
VEDAVEKRDEALAWRAKGDSRTKIVAVVWTKLVEEQGFELTSNVIPG